MRFFITLCLVIFIVPMLFAQQLRFDRIDVADGLSQNNIHSMEFDSNGKLWVGTLDGLNCYDGYNFTVYKPFRNSTTSIVGNFIMQIGQGLNGNMWVITRNGGLNYFDAERKIFEHIPDSVFGTFNVESFKHIVQTNDSTLWLASVGTIAMLNLKSNKFFKKKLENEITDLVIDLNDNVVVASASEGLKQVRFNERNRFDFEILNEMPVHDLYKGNGEIYARSFNTIYALTADGSSYDLRFKLAQGNGNKLIDFAVVDSVCWAGGFNSLLKCYKANGEFVNEQIKYDALNPSSFKGYSVSQILVDGNKNLWIGTNKNGLNHLNNSKNQFTHYRGVFDMQADPWSNPVRAICKTRTGNLWLAYDRDALGLLMANGQQRFYRYYYDKNNKQRLIRTIRVLFEDSRGDIWIGVDGNLCLYNYETDRIETVDNRFNWRWPFRCYVIKEFEPGILTISSGASLGFVNLDDGEMTVFSVPESRGSIRDIVQDKYRNIWIAQDGSGLIKINYPSLKAELILADTHGLSDGKVYSVVSIDNKLWIGTNSGLNLFDIEQNKVTDQFFEEDGLSNNIVYSVYTHDKESLWMSTSKGVSLFNTTDYSFRTYLHDDYFMDDAHFKADDGCIFFGGYTGVISFSPDEIQQKALDLKPRFEAFFLFDKRIVAGDTIDGKVLFSTPFSEVKKIRLTHKQNTFSIGFNAYPFNYPNGNQFRFKLEGLQYNWVYSNTNKQITYNKLQPGNYTFQLQATSDNALYSDTISVEIIIVPPFWQRFWFRFLVLLVVIVIVFTSYQYRLAQINQRNLWLNRKVDEQTAELKSQNKTIKEISEKLHEADELKLRFFTNVSHEFRTPLTLILGQIDNLNGESKQAVKSIKNNANRLLRLVNQVIDLRKMDQEQMKLSVSQINFVAFAKSIVESFVPLADKKNIELLFYADVDELQVWLDEDKTEKIIYNLLSNALKYTPRNKVVKVHVSTTKEQFQFCIADEGIGISEKDIAHVFDRFYRSDAGSQTSTGHGIGLSMVKSLTELQKGKIDITSELQKGSNFTLTFLLGNNHFNSDDLIEIEKSEAFLLDETQDEVVFDQRLGGRKILIVEDNEELSLFLKGILASNFNTQVAGNGKEALKKMQDFIPDLIVSDIMMPVMDGITFCQHVKANIQTSHIPFILLTAKTDSDTQVEGFELGVDAFVEKPFHSSILVARIQSLLSNRILLKDQFEKTAQHFPILDKVAKNDQKFVEKVNRLVDENYSESSFSVDRLSEMMNMSRATFYRKFSELTGTAPADYIRKVRLRKAYRLIADKESTITQICGQVGFQSVSHFRKCFKNEFGKTPSELQKNVD